MGEALLWHEVLAAWKKLETDGVPKIPALYQSMDQIVQSQAEKLAIPRRYGSDMKEIWALQSRFLQRSGRRPYRLLEHPRFRAAYDFLLLRCASGEVDAAIGEWWTRFEHASDAERTAMLTEDAEPGKRRRRRRRRRSGPDEARDQPESV